MKISGTVLEFTTNQFMFKLFSVISLVIVAPGYVILAVWGDILGMWSTYRCGGK